MPPHGRLKGEGMFVVFVNGEPDWCTPFEVSALEFADVMRARGYHVEVEEQ